MKYLRNRNTRVVFPYCPKLAKNKNMEPCAKDGRSAFEEVSADLEAIETPANPDAQEPESQTTGQDLQMPGAGEGEGGLSDNGIIIDKATRPELIKFAKDNFGVDLDKALKVGELREEVKALASAS